MDCQPAVLPGAPAADVSTSAVLRMREAQVTCSAAAVVSSHRAELPFWNPPRVIICCHCFNVSMQFPIFPILKGTASAMRQHRTITSAETFQKWLTMTTPSTSPSLE